MTSTAPQVARDVAELVYRHARQYPGLEQGELAAATGCTPRQVRRAVHLLRVEGRLLPRGWVILRRPVAVRWDPIEMQIVRRLRRRPWRVVDLVADLGRPTRDALANLRREELVSTANGCVPSITGGSK